MNCGSFWEVGAGLLALYSAFWSGAYHETEEVTLSNFLGWISVIILLGLLVTT